jgi:putative ABC transport system substrate-binding protein
MMRRRDFLKGLGSLALPLPSAAAAQTGKFYRLGTLTPNAPASETSQAGQILIKVLGQRGFVLGQNLAFESRGAMGDVAKLPALVAELKVHKADAIVVIGYPTALAAKATGIPTVAASILCAAARDKVRPSC